MNQSATLTPRQTSTVREAADALGVSLPTVYAAVRSGRLPSIRVGSRWLVPRPAFEALLRGESTPRPAESTRSDRPAA